MKAKHFTKTSKWIQYFAAVFFILAPVCALDAAPLWYHIQPLPQSNTLKSVTCSSFDCNAVGYGGASLNIAANARMVAGRPYSSAYLTSNTYGTISGKSAYVATTLQSQTDPYSYILTSTNGYKWGATGGKIFRGSNTLPYVLDIIWTGSRYIATGVALNYNTFAYEPFLAASVGSDTTQWTYTALTLSHAYSFTTAVASSPDGLNIVAVGGTTFTPGYSEVYTSNNGGDSWTMTTPALASPTVLNGVAWDDANGRFVAVGNNGTILTSNANGTSWTDLSIVNGPHLLAIASGNSMLAAVGNGVALTSSDGGSSWVYGLNVSDNLSSVTWSGTEMLAVGANGAVVVSYDGLLWFSWDFAETNAPTYYDVAAQTIDPYTVVAAGSLGRLDVSADNGGSWTSKVTAIADEFRSVEWVETLNQFVAVGWSGLVKRSSSGTAWTSAATVMSGNFYGVGHRVVAGVPTVVAVGANTYTSSNASTWTLRTEPASTNVNNKYAVAGKPETNVTASIPDFVAVGANNTIEHSSDNGVTWVAATSPTATVTEVLDGNGNTTTPGVTVVWNDVFWSSRYNTYFSAGTQTTKTRAGYTGGTGGTITYTDKGIVGWYNTSIWRDLTNNASYAYFTGINDDIEFLSMHGTNTDIYIVGTEQKGGVFGSTVGVVFENTTVGNFGAWNRVSIPSSPRLSGVIPIITAASTGAIAVGDNATVLSKLPDTSPPSQINGPADLTIPVDSVTGTAISYKDSRVQAWLSQFSAVDDRDITILDIVDDAPSSFLPNVPVTITFTATDRAGNATTAATIQRVVLADDVTAPVVTAPTGISVASQNNLGTGIVGPVSTFLSAATATDNVDGAVVAQVLPAPTNFPIGTTSVTFEATDAAGNTGTAVSTVTVTDGVAPTITMPDNKVIAATGPSDVLFSDPYVQSYINAIRVVDDVDPGAPAISAVTQPVFPVGAGWIQVDVYADDKAGNRAFGSGFIMVEDQASPVITPPANITIPSTNGLGVHFMDAAVVSFATGATAVDNVDLTIAPIDIYSDITTFISIGTTPVTFYTDDAAGNRGIAKANITVWDAQAPSVYLPNPADLVLSADTAAGLSLTDPYVQQYINAVVALDDYEGQIATVTNNAPSNLPMNATTSIQFTAVDTYGNVGTSTGSITVIDISAPIITAPADISVLATSALGTDVGNALIQTFLAGATVRDNVDTAITIFNDAPTVFPIGKTKVNFIADDTSGNRSVVTATVEITSGTGGTVEPSSCLIGAGSSPSIFSLMPFLSVLLMGLGIGVGRKTLKN